jgi:hypothetical protein
MPGFNLSSALGRICFGLGADRLLGSLNALVLCLVTVSVSTLLIWPFANALAPLCVRFPRPSQAEDTLTEHYSI